jgi:hypothetical protein
MSSIQLTSAAVGAEIVPGEGARVQHIVDRRTGRELLLQRTPAPGPRDDYLASCAGGWDELFPTDSPWGGFPDHGLVWTAPFQIRETTDQAVTLTASLDRPAVEIVRRFSLLPPPRRGVRAETVLSAEGSTGPFLWAAHPMLAVAEGWTIELPPTSTNLAADAVLPGRHEPGSLLTRAVWEAASGIPSRTAELCEVVYVEGVTEATAWAPGRQVGTRVVWDGSFLTHLWLVTITGRFGLDDCLLIEPCTSRPYRLEEAIEAGTASSLDAGEQVEWWVEVESVGTGG